MYDSLPNPDFFFSFYSLLAGEEYFLPIESDNPEASKVYPLGLGKDHLGTTLATIKWICEVAGRLGDGVTYKKEVQQDGSEVFLGSPTEDQRVKTLVKNLNKSWEIGGASSVSCATFEPDVLRLAFSKVARETNATVWEQDMRTYICVRSPGA